MSRELNGMSNAIKEFILDRKNSKIEVLLKTKFLKDKDKGLNQYLINKIDKNNEELQVIINSKKEKAQSSVNFQKDKNINLIKLAQKLDINVLDITQQYQEKLQQLEKQHIVENWLDDNCHNAGKISIGTHIAKLTHSSNKGTCFYDNVITCLNHGYLTTSQLKDIIADASYENALYAPIASLLLVENKGKYLYKMVIDDDFSAFDKLTESTVQLDNWIQNLKQAFEKTTKYSHSFSKQLYFPIDKVNSYHLLSLLASSSLMQVVFERVNKKNVDISKQKKNGKYSIGELISYPNRATVSITKSSHQNSSKLNGKRNGRSFLFSTQPPTWQSQLKPPIYKKSIFDSYYCPENTTDNIKYLVDFILRNESIDLSTRDPEKQKWLEKWTIYIIDDFWFFVGNIHELASGWSSEKGAKLKVEHQYLLDPYRKDNQFQANRKDNAWQKVVVNDFSIWLNKQLKKKDKKFTAQAEYSQTWKKLMEKELREYNQIISADTDLEVSV